MFEMRVRAPAASPALWGALDGLMRCGLRRIVLKANQLFGTLPEQLPASANGWLKTLNLGENQIEGTLVGCMGDVSGLQGGLHGGLHGQHAPRACALRRRTSKATCGALAARPEPLNPTP
jgi:hypothetical protein